MRDLLIAPSWRAVQLGRMRQLDFSSDFGGGGLDALGWSKRLRKPAQALGWLARADEVLARVPALARAGLNLAVRARKR